MKKCVWSGELPKYWVESPWWANLSSDIVFLVPEENGRSLIRLNSCGDTIWETPTVSNVLLMSQDGVILTSRVRDGRSDAVYYEFLAYDGCNGKRLWGLTSEVSVHVPKGSLPFNVNTLGNQGMVRLDRWRSLRTGEVIDSSPAEPGFGQEEWSFGATQLCEAEGVLTVLHDHHKWSLAGVSLRDVVGITGNLLVGKVRDRATWARELELGRLAWSMNYDENGVVVPSERIAGCDAYVWKDASIVPVMAVVKQQDVMFLQASESGPALVRWPDRTVIEQWERNAQVVLLGASGEGFLVLEEFNDGMGSVWHTQ